MGIPKLVKWDPECCCKIGNPSKNSSIVKISFVLIIRFNYLIALKFAMVIGCVTTMCSTKIGNDWVSETEDKVIDNLDLMDF